MQILSDLGGRVYIDIAESNEPPPYPSKSEYICK